VTARRLQTAAGVVLAAVAIAVVAIAATSGAGNRQARPQTAGGGPRIANVAIAPPLARPLPGGLPAAAAAAGCALSDPPSEGRSHVTGPVSYRSNPPSSGPHFPLPAHDGIYDPGATPPKEQLVHSLEHGRIEIQYRPGTSSAAIGQLQSLVYEFARRNSDPRVLLFQNTTAMPFAVAAVAWGHILGCSAYRPAVLDAIRAFRSAYDLKAPERFFVDAE
jgi:hypothetical protein